jgi:PEP-CTERM motif
VHGIYAVLPIGSVASQAAYGDWTNVTVDPSGGHGNVFVADGATKPNATVWQETVAVTAHTNYVFSYYAAEISNACCSNAVFVPTIAGSSGSGQTLTGGWAQYTFSWNSGTNTVVSLSLTDTNTSGAYNDFVLDDLSLLQVSAVPEPSTWAMMMIGFLGLGFMAYRRKNVGLSFA